MFLLFAKHLYLLLPKKFELYGLTCDHPVFPPWLAQIKTAPCENNDDVAVGYIDNNNRTTTTTKTTTTLMVEDGKYIVTVGDDDAD